MAQMLSSLPSHPRPKTSLSSCPSAVSERFLELHRGNDHFPYTSISPLFASFLLWNSLPLSLRYPDLSPGSFTNEARPTMLAFTSFTNDLLHSYMGFLLSLVKKPFKLKKPVGFPIKSINQSFNQGCLSVNLECNIWPLASVVVYANGWRFWPEVRLGFEQCQASKTWQKQ